MFSFFLSRSFSSSLTVEPGASETIDVYNRTFLVPIDASSWNGVVFLEENHERYNIFGNTSRTLIRFEADGFIEVYNKENVTRVFNYYIFFFNNCTNYDIIVHPYNDFFYQIANNTYSPRNETMQNSYNRCFYFILDQEYTFDFYLIETEKTYDKLYVTENIESQYSEHYPHYTNLTKNYSSALFVNWQTDVSVTLGLVGFRAHTDGNLPFYNISGNTRFFTMRKHYYNYYTDTIESRLYTYSDCVMVVIIIVSVWVLFVINLVSSYIVCCRFDNRLESNIYMPLSTIKDSVNTLNTKIQNEPSSDDNNETSQQSPPPNDNVSTSPEETKSEMPFNPYTDLT